MSRSEHGHQESRAAAPSCCYPIPGRGADDSRSNWAGMRGLCSESVARLNCFRPPTDVPRHRWHQFVSDCHNFLNSSENWGERAAELGWDARALFGCHRNYPLMHLGSAGLLWAINGGKLVELHRDWAVIELPVNRSQRIFYRRDVAAGKVTLPWDRA